ncbi:MAG: TM2 domain-containing protein [Duncaniella sp.]|nr:TM2 domain-containing protein [Duncaniella sp.]
MKEQEVNMWIMTNKDALPEGNLPHIRAKLLEMSEDEWTNVSLLEFKSPMTLLMVSIFLGSLGVDRFMLVQTGAGIGKLLTGGGCGIWWLIDLFNINKLTKEYNWKKLSMWI